MPAAKTPQINGSKPGKVWEDALRRAVHRPSDTDKQLKRIEVIADQCARMAENGDMQAIKEIGDRLDGKPAQAVALTDKDGQDLDFTISFVPASQPQVVDAEYSEVGKPQAIEDKQEINDISGLARPENGTDL